MSDRVNEWDGGNEVFKDSPEWIAAYEQIKRLLKQREHVE